MPRLIDADTFIAQHCGACKYFKANGICVAEQSLCRSVRIVNELPTIDVVRCKQCKFWDIEHPDSGQGWCPLIVGYRRGNWYCAAGERKDNE